MSLSSGFRFYSFNCLFLALNSEKCQEEGALKAENRQTIRTLNCSVPVVLLYVAVYQTKHHIFLNGEVILNLKSFWVLYDIL